jgi:hypothetical protein
MQDPGSDLYVAVGGTFTASATGAIRAATPGAALPTVRVSGTFNSDPATQPGGQAKTTIEAKFVLNTGGQVNVDIGDMLLLQGSSSAAGTYTISAGATLSFWAIPNSGTPGLLHSLANTTLNGAGLARFGVTSDNAVTIVGIVNAQNMLQLGGVLNGVGTLKVKGTYTWRGGSWLDAGVTQILGTLVINNISGTPLDLETRTLTNQNTVTWLAGDITVSNGGNINNLGGALFDIQCDAHLDAGAGAGKFTDYGGAVLRKSAGTGITWIGPETDFKPRHRIEKQTGWLVFPYRVLNPGDILLQGDGGLQAQAGFEQDDPGTLQVFANNTVSVTGDFIQTGGLTTATFDPTTIVVDGDFEESGGELDLHSYGGSGGSLTVTGTATLSGGLLNLTTLDVAGYPMVTATELDITDTGVLYSQDGTVEADVYNAGTLDVGDEDCPRLLTITGDYAQAAAGVLQVGVGGFPPTSDPQLIVSGHATFGGTLTMLSSTNPIPAAPVTSLTIVRFGSYDGAFASRELPSLIFGHWDPRYDDPAGTFTLWVVGTGP